MDPFYERLTPQYKIRKNLERLWPSLYAGINAIFWALVDNLKAMISSIRNSF